MAQEVKLTIDEFRKGLKMLSMEYLTFKMDAFDEDTIKHWYRRFSGYNYNMFREMIYAYCDNNTYPPKSPADILQYGKKLIENMIIGQDQGWQIVIDCVRSYGLSYDPERFYQKVRERGNEALEVIARRFHSDLQNLQVGDTYTPNTFKKAYADYIKNSIESGNLLQLGVKNQMLLGGGNND